MSVFSRIVPRDRVLSVAYSHVFATGGLNPYWLDCQIVSRFDTDFRSTGYPTRESRKAALLRELDQWQARGIEPRIS